MKKFTKLTLLTLTVVVAMIASACASDNGGDAGGSGGGGDKAASSPGVTDDEILFGMATPTSGNASSLGIDGQKGLEVFIKWLNDKGGTNGRKWRLVVQDDGFDLQKKVTAVQYLIQQEGVFAILGDVGSQAVAALPVINKDKVPYLFPYALAQQMVKPVQPTVFMSIPMADAQEQALSDYLGGELTGTHKIGLLTLNSADGGDAVRGFKAGKAGKWVVSEQQYERTATSWEPQLVSMKDAGVTDIVIHGSDVWTAKIMNETRKLGMNVQFYGSSGSVTPQTFALAEGDVADGAHAVAIFAPATATDIPGVKEFMDAFAKYEPGYEPGAFALSSWVGGLITAGALETIDGTPTREKLVKALEGLKDFDTGGITAPQTFSKDDHQGSTSVMIVEGKAGKWVPVTDWLSADS
ncbi:MAG: ABC transporter substrate-binding protein [Microthrixaceae bacterium]